MKVSCGELYCNIATGEVNKKVLSLRYSNKENVYSFGTAYTYDLTVKIPLFKRILFA